MLCIFSKTSLCLIQIKACSTPKCSSQIILFTCSSSFTLQTGGMSSTFPIYLHKLASIQNKAVKLIGRGHFLESTTQLYVKLKMLKLFDLYKYETSKIVHDYMNSNLPLSFSNYFNKSREVSNHSTRTSVNPYNLYKPLYRTNRMQRSIKH